MSNAKKDAKNKKSLNDMYIKHFKNKPINFKSWLFASRARLYINDNYLLLGQEKVKPNNIQSVEKKSWFTKNYFIVTFLYNNNKYVLSVTEKYYKKIDKKFTVTKLATTENIVNNLFWSALIIGVLYSWYYLLSS